MSFRKENGMDVCDETQVHFNSLHLQAWGSKGKGRKNSHILRELQGSQTPGEESGQLHQKGEVQEECQRHKGFCW